MGQHLEGRPCKRTPTNVDLRLVSPDPDQLADARADLIREHGSNWEQRRMPYRSVLGSVQHLMVSTRPELSFAVSYLSRFMSCFLREHWVEALRTMQYLKLYPDRKFVISRDKLPDLTLSAWVDSDWAGDPEQRRSVSGMIVYLGKVPILWKSQMQARTSLSSGEAEFIAVGEVTRHVLMLRYVMDEMGFGQTEPTTVHCDASAALQALEKQKCDSKLKHVATRFHRTRQEVALGTIRLRKVSSKQNVADGFTKSLRKDDFDTFADWVYSGPVEVDAQAS